MSKKIFKLICFTLFCLLTGVTAILAIDPYDCAYDVTFHSTTYRIIVTMHPEYTSITGKVECVKTDNIVCGGGLNGSLDYELAYNDETLDQQQVMDDLKKYAFSGVCDDKVYILKYWSNGAQTNYFKILFNDTLEGNVNKFVEDNSKGTGTYKDAELEWGQYNSEYSTASSKSITYNCDAYKNLNDSLNHLSEQIKVCSNDCAKLRMDYREKKEKLSAFCNVQLSYTDYGASCLMPCLSHEDPLEKIDNEVLREECGFSGRLLSFFANILRWIKYILPVVAIVLGILDFMKAMGAEKQDEMKKAQGRFVKRLIAAALLFIVPLILEFVLDKMGFGYDDCGLF